MPTIIYGMLKEEKQRSLEMPAATNIRVVGGN